jgi:hypothetical protein
MEFMIALGRHNIASYPRARVRVNIMGDAGILGASKGVIDRAMALSTLDRISTATAPPLLVATSDDPFSFRDRSG